jgi:hypothetical protein
MLALLWFIITAALIGCFCWLVVLYASDDDRNGPNDHPFTPTTGSGWNAAHNFNSSR